MTDTYEISAEEYLATANGKQRKRGKYGNKHTEVDGYTFDSLAEARRYQELKLLQAAGEIDGLTIHPVYILQEAFIDNGGKEHQAVTYETDFAYVNVHGVTVCEDVKGVLTDVFKIKQKLFVKRYPDIELRIVRM
jgi:hypothetical protein